MEKKPRKTRRDSKLGDLPEDQRKLIAHWLERLGVDSCLFRMRSELGISSNKDSVYKALKRWEIEAQNNVYLSLARAQAELMSEAKGGMTVEEMEEAVDLNFIILASQKKDLSEYKDLRYMRIADKSAKANAKIANQKLAQKDRQLAQKDQDFALAREKFVTESCEKIMQAARDPKMREIVEDTTTTNAQKIASIRKAYFADIDALQASGKVVLPE